MNAVLCRLAITLSLALVPFAAKATDSPYTCTGVSDGPDIDQVCTRATPGKWARWKARFGFGGLGKNHAIVVGISDYDDARSFQSLPTREDPIRMRDYLLHEAEFDHVHTLTGRAVTRDRIRELMDDEFPDLMGKQDRFLFYWSGHGKTRQLSRGGDVGYLVLPNSRRDSFASMLSMSDILRWNQTIPAAKTLYLLDSCFAGLAAVAAMSDQEELARELYGEDSQHILPAGLEDQQVIAVENLPYGRGTITGSIFLHSVLEGVRGAADYTGDGIVALNELETYVQVRTNELRRAAGWRDTINPRLHDIGESEGAFFFFRPDAEEVIARPSQDVENESERTAAIPLGEQPESTSTLLQERSAEPVLVVHRLNDTEYEPAANRQQIGWGRIGEIRLRDNEVAPRLFIRSPDFEKLVSNLAHQFHQKGTLSVTDGYNQLRGFIFDTGQRFSDLSSGVALYSSPPRDYAADAEGLLPQSGVVDYLGEGQYRLGNIELIAPPFPPGYFEVWALFENVGFQPL